MTIGSIGRLPWVAPADVWERIVLHVVISETARNRAMILVAYDGALRREELVSLRLDDYDHHRAAQGPRRDVQIRTGPLGPTLTDWPARVGPLPGS